jgi:four helix bundle protein
VSANIVEGCGHDGAREFSRYLRIALASANELEYHLLAARDLRLLDAKAHARLEADTQRLKRMLYVLLERIRAGDDGRES